MPQRAPSLALLLLLSLATAASAQPSHPAALFPLTATRYGAARGFAPRILSNGREPVVFWMYGHQQVRVSRLVNGRFTASRLVGEGAYDVLWNGASFVLVTHTSADEGGLVVRLLDAGGEPRGEPLRIVERGYNPRIAFNGRNILLLYHAAIEPTPEYGVHALLLDAQGRPVESEPRSLGVPLNGVIGMASNGDSFAALVPTYREPVLLFFGANGQERSRTLFSDYGATVALATDGRRYLGVAACSTFGLCMPAVARVIEPDGSIGAPVELDEPFRMNPTAVWSGTKWIVAYTRDLHLEEAAALEVLQLDASARVVERRESRSAFLSSLGVAGGRVLAAWTTGGYYDRIHVGPVPFDDATSLVASFTASEQALAAAKSSSRGTLVVWREQSGGRTSVHAGFRALDGTWRERELYAAQPRDCFVCYDEFIDVQLAGNGEGFLLHLQHASGSASPEVVQRLDAEGDPVGEPIPVPFLPQRIFSDGRDFLILHSGQWVARMTPSGTIVSNRQLPSIVGQAADYAVSGNGSFLAVRIDTTYIDHYPHILGISVVRLDRDLNPIDETPIRLAADDQQLYGSVPHAGWDGRQWIVAWNGREGFMAAQLAESGPANPKVVKLVDGRVYEAVIEPVPGAAAILLDQPWDVNRLAFLRHDGTVVPPIVVSSTESDRGYESGEIAPLPNGDVAYVESSLQRAAPFEGTNRVMFRVISNAPLPPRPDAPVLTVAGSVLTWEAPPQPVDGFRVEARIDGGPWTEIAPPLDREARTLRVLLDPASRYVFRIRAWNEAGMGEWSSLGRRRRAMR